MKEPEDRRARGRGIQEMQNSGDAESRRWEIQKMEETGDGESRRWEIWEMGNLGDGNPGEAESRRWESRRCKRQEMGNPGEPQVQLRLPGPEVGTPWLCRGGEGRSFPAGEKFLVPAPWQCQLAPDDSQLLFIGVLCCLTSVSLPPFLENHKSRCSAGWIMRARA